MHDLRRRSEAVLLALSGVIALLTCPFPDATPRGGLDDSWGFALHAWATGSHGGVPVTYFTYGPLGFLAVPVVWERTGYALALAFFLLVQLALCRLLLARLLRVAPLLVAAPVTLLLAALVDDYAAETLLVVAALLTAELLERGVRRPRAALAVGCALSGLSLLLKFSTGLVSLLVLTAVSAALAGPGARRRLAAAGTAVAGSLAVSWLAFAVVTGHPTAFPAWLHGSKEIAGGYVAMAYELTGGGTQDDYAWVAPLLLLLVVAAAVQAAVRRTPASWAASGVLLLVLYLSFREGFTRHDGTHVAVLVSALTLLPLALSPGRRARWLLVPLVLGPVAYGVLQSGTTELGDRYDLAANVQRLADRLHLLRDAAPVQERARRDLQARFALPDDVRRALEGHRVHVDPHDTAVLWAYGLRWGPTAVWAGYSSYTPWLDGRSAASLRGADAPDRVLRSLTAGAIDARQPLWESPRYQLELQCRWRPVATSRAWQVLAPGPDRCAPAVPLGTAQVRAGRPFPVPAARHPGALVTMRVRLDLPWSYRWEALLFKPHAPRFALVDGRRTRLVLADLVAGDEPLLVSVPADGPGTPAGPGPHAVRQVVLPYDATVVFEEVDRS